jgi:hypothetical protein
LDSNMFQLFCFLFFFNASHAGSEGDPQFLLGPLPKFILKLYL